MQLESISKSFPGVRALHRVSIEFGRAEVHALVGANGAGKSTLIQIMSGVIPADSGAIRWNGQEVQFLSPLDAGQLGIVAVHQEGEFFPSLSIAENIELVSGIVDRPVKRGRKRWFLDWRTIEEQARRVLDGVLDQANCPVDTRIAASNLSVAQRQLIQICSAIHRGVRMLILDEPSSALSGAECNWLFAQIRELKQAGATIVYISHRHEEVLSIADRITILREGQVVWSGVRQDTTSEELVARMIGRAYEPHKPASESEPNPTRDPMGQHVPALRLVGLTDVHGRFQEIDLAVWSGEVVGLYGLVGAGRSELAQALFGRRPYSGQILRDGQPIRIRSTPDAVRHGIAYVPEDRLRQGVFRGLSVRANSVVSSLVKWCRGPFVSRRREFEAAQTLVKEYRVVHQHLEQPLGHLSGGNQQKIVLGRWMATSPKVLLLDEPTRGIDVGAKREIYESILKWAKSGMAIVLIASDPDEVWEQSDRVIVICEGRVKQQFNTRTQRKSDMAAAAFSTPADRQDRTQKSPKVNRLSFVPAVKRAGGPMVVAIVLGIAWLLAGGGDVATWATTASMWIVLALSATLSILVGGIDISIGAVVALSAALAAVVLRIPGPEGLMTMLAICASVLVGAGCGWLNAVMALFGRVHPIVVTLGTMTIWRGAVISILGGKAVTGIPSSYSQFMSGNMHGALWLTALTVGALWLWIECTASGRRLLAVGANPTAALRCGISRSRTWLVAFSVGGGLAGLCGAMQLGYSGQMQAQLGIGWELTAISAAVIGGVAISGGRARVLDVVAGAISLRLINSLLIRWGVVEDRFELVAGLLLVTAIVLDRISRQRVGSGEPS